MAERASAVADHYGGSGLGERILEALRATGKDPAALTPADLAPFDQLHTRGRAATVELAELAGLRPGAVVLDVGSGIGGPARVLAAEFGCRVTGLDLTEAFCRAAELLTLSTGLADRVVFRHGDATAMPFADGGFDVVWTQHTAMNIADKSRLYAEIHRVLRRGGRLALNDILAGPEVDGLHFPVPWASSPALSFLVGAATLRGLIAAAGFREAAWRDRTEATTEWCREAAARSAAPGFSPERHPVMGSGFPAKIANLRRNLEEDRIRVVQAVFDRIG